MKNLLSKMAGAFVIGGVIAIVTQAILQFFLQVVHVSDFMMAVRYTLVVHAAIGSVLAAVGIYKKLEDAGGMGAAIPVAGLASAITGGIIGERAKGKSRPAAVVAGLKLPLTILGIGLALGLFGALVCLIIGFKVV